jgi:hypothetical protein
MAGHSVNGGDLGAALLNGSLPLAEGAPSPPALHPDPMLDFYKNMCSDAPPMQHVAGGISWDPMLEEIETVCSRVMEETYLFLSVISVTSEV